VLMQVLASAVCRVCPRRRAWEGRTPLRTKVFTEGGCHSRLPPGGHRCTRPAVLLLVLDMVSCVCAAPTVCTGWEGVGATAAELEGSVGRCGRERL